MESNYSLHENSASISKSWLLRIKEVVKDLVQRRTSNHWELEGEESTSGFWSSNDFDGISSSMNFLVIPATAQDF